MGPAPARFPERAANTGRLHGNRRPASGKRGEFTGLFRLRGPLFLCATAMFRAFHARSRASSGGTVEILRFGSRPMDDSRPRMTRCGPARRAWDVGDVLFPKSICLERGQYMDTR